MSNNYGNRNANQHLRDHRNTDPQAERLYSNERNENSRIGKGYHNPMHNRKGSDSMMNVSDMFSMNEGKMSRYSMLNESRGDSRARLGYGGHPDNSMNPGNREMLSPRSGYR